MSLPLPYEHDGDYDPFDDGSQLPDRTFSDSDADLANGMRQKRDRSTRRRIKRADLESKTRELYRKAGYIYDKCEHFGYSGNRTDLFGFVDGIAVKEGEILFIQTTSRANKAVHLRKMATGEFSIGAGKKTPCYGAARALTALANVHLILVVWDQPEGPNTRWRHEITEVTAAMLEEYRSRSRRVPT